ncbi:hypothetical protein SAMN05421772_10870 [Paracoccus saliphilus]|uniref:Uncharacterized protein n=1 Tax=Paracoccus saliphilus TaxID=405559 RepID=A0AA45W541_9RHOB|nr:hypothetical protein SAMN05421772_10870 [Paracoccus saliphilus]
MADNEYAAIGPCGGVSGVIRVRCIPSAITALPLLQTIVAGSGYKQIDIVVTSLDFIIGRITDRARFPDRQPVTRERAP